MAPANQQSSCQSLRPQLAQPRCPDGAQTAQARLRIARESRNSRSASAAACYHSWCEMQSLSNRTDERPGAKSIAPAIAAIGALVGAAVYLPSGAELDLDRFDMPKELAL